MSKRFYSHILLILLFFFVTLIVYADNNIFTLVLDAGHGGHDSGAIGTYSKEKNINLNVALKVGELILKNCPDVKVIFTRKTDVFVDLHERAAIANHAKANLFISIHTNAIENGNTITGSETYSLGVARSNENLNVAKRENSVILYENNYQKRYAGFNPNSSESYIIFEFMQDQYMRQSAELARAIQNEYVNIANRPNKGVKQAGFLVLRETSMPSVLTELGFITTPQEEQYLNSAKGTDELAQSIYHGFLDYKNAYKRSLSVILNNADKKREERNTIEQNKVIKNLEKQETPTGIKNKQSETTKNQLIDSNKIKNEDYSEKKKDSSKIGNDNDIPLFKIQILTSSRRLRTDSRQFKGLDKIYFYQDKNIFKYTYGATSSYKEIVELRKTILNKFPDCFVIAMKGTEKISTQEALQELDHK